MQYRLGNLVHMNSTLASPAVIAKSGFARRFTADKSAPPLSVAMNLLRIAPADVSAARLELALMHGEAAAGVAG